MIRILPVDAQENLGRAIGMLVRNAVGGSSCKIRQGVEGTDLRIIGESRVGFFHDAFPTMNARPVVSRFWIGEESLGRRDKELFAFRGRLERLRLLDFVPASREVSGTGSRRPERLKESHGDTPMSHGALRIGLGHLLESFSRFRVGHMMEQSHGAIKLRLRCREQEMGKFTPPP